MKRELKSASEYTQEMIDRINRITNSEEVEETGEALDELAFANLITASQYMRLEVILGDKVFELINKGLI